MQNNIGEMAIMVRLNGSELATIVRTIQEHLDKAAQSTQRATDHYISAGLELKKLKAQKPQGRPWPDYVREQFNLSQQRADELIRIADGKTTVEDLRSEKRESMERSRKSTQRGVDSAQSDKEPRERSDNGPLPVDAVIRPPPERERSAVTVSVPASIFTPVQICLLAVRAAMDDCADELPVDEIPDMLTRIRRQIDVFEKEKQS